MDSSAEPMGEVKYGWSFAREPGIGRSGGSLEGLGRTMARRFCAQYWCLLSTSGRALWSLLRALSCMGQTDPVVRAAR